MKRSFIGSCSLNPRRSGKHSHSSKFSFSSAYFLERFLKFINIAKPYHKRKKRLWSKTRHMILKYQLELISKATFYLVYTLKRFAFAIFYMLVQFCLKELTWDIVYWTRVKDSCNYILIIIIINFMTECGHRIVAQLSAWPVPCTYPHWNFKKKSGNVPVTTNRRSRTFICWGTNLYEKIA